MAEDLPVHSYAPARTDWTEFEVKAIVDDYLDMLATEASGEPYSKTDHRRALNKKLNGNRSNGSIEFKHANISAVMINLGLPYIQGYKPRGNYQASLLEEIKRRLELDPSLIPSLRPTAIAEFARGPQLRRAKPAPPVKVAQRGTHFDYGLLQEESRRRGDYGEQLVVSYEQTSLRHSGHPELAERVRWVAREDGDGLGYDVLSYNVEGHVRHIEVKATAYGRETPFYISFAELEFARHHLDSYALYRVFDVLGSPEFYVLEGNVADMLTLMPVTYRAWPVAADENS